MCDSDVRAVDVSVVAANYNNAPFLRDFFEGWIASSVRPREFIFVDDGSSDDSLDIAEIYSSKLPGLRIVALKRNVGFANALNVGIGLATQNYILRVDPDDIVHPKRLELQYAAVSSGYADIVGTNALMFHSDSGRLIGESNFPTDHSRIARAYERGEHGVLHATVIARASLFRSHPYRQESVPAEDYDVFARMYLSGARFMNISDALLMYRIHARSASNILPVSTIKKTFVLRDALFGTRTPPWTVVSYYLYIRCYRNYLYSQHLLLRIVFLMLSASLRPSKAFRRVARKIFPHS